MELREIHLKHERDALNQKQRMKAVRMMKAKIELGLKEGERELEKHYSDEELLREAREIDKEDVVAIFDGENVIDWGADKHAGNELYQWLPEERAIVKTFHLNKEKNGWNVRQSERRIRMKKHPFGRGGLRFAFYCEEMVSSQHSRLEITRALF